MKYAFITLVFALIFIGCEVDKSLTFETVSFDNKTCKDCAEVSVKVPKALGNKKIDEAINIAIREEIISILQYDENVEAISIKSAMESFQSEYDQLRNKFPEESTPWEASIAGEVSFENEKLITIRLEYYLFTGGAHGYSSVRFLNFEKEKGKELENIELFKDLPSFQEMAEAKFRSQENIPLPNSINSTGFMFEGDNFYLPENIGFTKDGLQLFYEQYEVASYADGPIILVLPFEEVKNYIISLSS